MFHVKNTKLNQTRNNIIGTLPWYCNINKRLSSNNIIPFQRSSSERTVDSTEEEGIRGEMTDGLVLGSGTVGHCVGSINLPRDAVWCIHITILLKTSSYEDVDVGSVSACTGQPMPSSVNALGKGSSHISIEKAPSNSDTFQGDSITLRLGSSIDSMSRVGCYFDKVSTETGLVLHNIKHIIKGKCLAFRFDFSSLSSGKVCRLAVETGNCILLIDIT